MPFEAPCAILVPPTTAHGFRFHPDVTDGWVMSFTEDVAEAIGDRRGEALARLKALAADPVMPLGSAAETARLSRFAPSCTRSASSRAPASASRCAACSR